MALWLAKAACGENRVQMTARQPRFRDSWLIRIGVGLFILGTGPLWLITLFDKLGWMNDDNPLGPGLLAGVTLWPSVILIAAGMFAVRRARRRAKDDALE
jgi:hypothetical protein